VSRDDDEGRILRAARTIASSSPAFPVKIGINRGHVFAADIGTAFRRTFTVMGDTVNLAARLMSAAPAGSIYATAAVLDRAHTLFETVALEPFLVKGKSAPVQAYQVGDQVGTRDRSSHRGSTLVGRDREVKVIRTALARLADGRGSVITVVGDTGVGKTRLVEESLEAAPDIPAVKLQGEPYGADNPYWMFRDVLRGLLGIQRADQASMQSALTAAVRRLDPDLLGLLPLVGDVVAIEVPETEVSRSIEPRYRPERTAAAVIRLLDVQFEGPLVIHADDIHWTDEASQGLLSRIVGAAAGRPWLVIAGTRPEGATRLGQVTVLGPLGDDDSRAIAVEATRAAPLRTHELEAVVAKAGGNPLFLEEILRLVRHSGGVDELPESLDAVMAAEIDTLRPHTRRLLRYCSVLGRSFRRVVLDELLDDEDVGLDPATSRELARFMVVEGPDRLRFRHAVMQSAAYQGLSYKRRRELHQRAGDAIERLAGDDPDSAAEFLTIHFTIAGNAEKAWKLLLYGRPSGAGDLRQRRGRGSLPPCPRRLGEVAAGIRRGEGGHPHPARGRPGAGGNARSGARRIQGGPVALPWRRFGLRRPAPPVCSRPHAVRLLPGRPRRHDAGPSTGRARGEPRVPERPRPGRIRRRRRPDVPGTTPGSRASGPGGRLTRRGRG
jgi:hypothetical protein